VRTEELVQWKVGDSRRRSYEFEMYRRRVEVSFSQVRREEKSKNLWNLIFGRGRAGTR
jgi:hypothetical protein